MLKYILREKKYIILIIGVLLICSIAIAIAVYSQMSKQEPSYGKEPNEGIDYEFLKMDFRNIFTNNIRQEKIIAIEGKNIDYDNIISSKPFKQKKDLYDIDVNIPVINIESNVAKQLNEAIKVKYIDKVFDIVENTKANTIYSISYVAYINEDVLSLVIEERLKELADKPQRLIIQTINYDLKEDKLLSLEEIIKKKGLKNSEVQDKINAEIQISFEENVEGMYQVDPTQDIYKIENTGQFFIGKNGYIYILYPYGNKNYTDRTDIIIL